MTSKSLAGIPDPLNESTLVAVRGTHVCPVKNIFRAPLESTIRLLNSAGTIENRSFALLTGWEIPIRRNDAESRGGQRNTWIAHAGESGVQVSGMVGDVVFDKTGDEMIAVIVTRLHADSHRLPHGIAGRLEIIR
jgi:hypothetical protein